MTRGFFYLALMFMMLNLSAAEDTTIPAPAKETAKHFRPERMRADVKFLSDDLLEGRGTGVRGGYLAEQYIATQFEMAGLKPLGDSGTYLQKVPLIGVFTQPESALKFTPAKGEPLSPKFLDEFVANSLTLQPEVNLDAPVVFVGYGISAPEMNWNDYAGVDMKGKILLSFVNDPPSDDPKVFGGKAMTYYGRWTYKFEEAARQKAAGILLIHNTAKAAYGWNVVRNSNTSEQAYLELKPDENAVPMAGWISEDFADRLMKSVGQDLTQLYDAAGKRGFKPVELPLRLQGKLVAKIRQLEAHNIIGMLEGSDPKLRDEAIIYTAHYDHLGIGQPVNNDTIYNGAEDNASGTGMLLELARSFAEAPSRPRRSVVFLSVTAEERGLRGSEYYGRDPKIPPKKTMLDLNYDGVTMWGETTDVTLTGADRTSVWPIVQSICKEIGYKIEPEEHPEAGYYYRSDHFSLAKVGIPAFSIDAGNDFVGKPKEFGEQKYKEYLEQHYHQPSDEFRPEWDFAGAKKLAELGIYVGWRVADSNETTGWRAGDEFEKARK